MQKLSFGNRILVLLGTTESEMVSALPGPFAMLLSADTAASGIGQQKLIDVAIAKGCLEFCCVGKYSEELHDRIDEVLEEQELVHVVTTWHADEPLEDSVHYFVNLAGSKAATLVAVIDEGSRLQNILIDMAKNTAGSTPRMPIGR